MAVNVNLDEADSTRRVRSALAGGAVLLLLAAALEQAGTDPRQAAFAVAAALTTVCLAAASAAAAAAAAQRPSALRIRPDGRLRLVLADGSTVEAEALAARRLPGLIWLRIAPSYGASGPARVDPDGVVADRGQSSGSVTTCLLDRRSLGEADWAALNRWIVWRRRGGPTRSTATIPELTRSS